MEVSANPPILVLPSFYPMRYNYAGNFFEEQTRLIKKHGIDISVVYNENRTIASFNLKKFWHLHFQKQYKIEEGVPVFRRMNWNIIPAKFKLGRKIWIKESINLVETYIKKYGEPKLIHVHCALNAGSVAKYIKGKWHIPYIVTEHLSDYGYHSISEAKRQETLDVYLNAEKVITVSSYLKRILSEKTGFPEKAMEVIPNFIDTEYFNPNENIKLISPVKGKIIFTVCNLEYRKRLDRLLDAFKIVAELYPDWKLIIGGSGVEGENLKTQVKEINLQDKVFFAGFLTKEQVRAYMKSADIFVLSSDVETFGVVLIEAMSMGIPSVATASGGSEDIPTKDTGIIVDRNVTALANGIIEVISNYSNYNKNQIREHAVNHYSGIAIVKKYIDLYNKTIA